MSCFGAWGRFERSFAPERAGPRQGGVRNAAAVRAAARTIGPLGSPAHGCLFAHGCSAPFRRSAHGGRVSAGKALPMYYQGPAHTQSGGRDARWLSVGRWRPSVEWQSLVRWTGSDTASHSPAGRRLGQWRRLFDGRRCLFFCQYSARGGLTGLARHGARLPGHSDCRGDRWQPCCWQLRPVTASKPRNNWLTRTSSRFGRDQCWRRQPSRQA